MVNPTKKNRALEGLKYRARFEWDRVFLKHEAGQESEDCGIRDILGSVRASEVLDEGLHIGPAVYLKTVSPLKHCGVGSGWRVNIALISAVGEREHREVFIARWNEPCVDQSALEVEWELVGRRIARRHRDQVKCV